MLLALAVSVDRRSYDRENKFRHEPASLSGAAANGDAVLDGILKRRREEEGDPNWRPRWAEGVAIGNRVRGILLQRFRAARRLGSTFSQDQPDLAISFYDATGNSRTAAT